MSPEPSEARTLKHGRCQSTWPSLMTSRRDLRPEQELLLDGEQEPIMRAKTGERALYAVVRLLLQPSLYAFRPFQGSNSQ